MYIMVLRFRHKIRKVGKSHVVTVPKTYVDNYLSDDTEYEFQINIDRGESN